MVIKFGILSGLGHISEKQSEVGIWGWVILGCSAFRRNAGKAANGRSGVGCGLCGSLAFADPRGSPGPHWPQRGTGARLSIFLSVFGCQLLEEKMTAVSHHSQCFLSSPLRSLRALFHSDYANLHPLQRCMGLPCAPHPRQCLLSLAFLITDLLIVVGCYLGVVLMLISLMIGDTEHLFMNVLAVCTSSLEKCLFRSFAYFFIGKEMTTEYRREICTHTFTVALFTIANIWRQPKCPSVEEWINKMWYVYNRILFSHEKWQNPAIWANIDEP